MNSRVKRVFLYSSLLLIFLTVAEPTSAETSVDVAEKRTFYFSWTRRDLLKSNLKRAGNLVEGYEDRGKQVTQSLLDFIAEKQWRSENLLKGGTGLYVATNPVTSSRYGKHLLIVEVSSANGHDLEVGIQDRNFVDLVHAIQDYGPRTYRVIRRALNETEQQNFKMFIREARKRDAKYLARQASTPKELFDLVSGAAHIVVSHEIKSADSKSERFVHELAFGESFEQLLRIEDLSGLDPHNFRRGLETIEQALNVARLPNSTRRRFSEMAAKWISGIESPEVNRGSTHPNTTIGSCQMVFGG